MRIGFGCHNASGVVSDSAKAMPSYRISFPSYRRKAVSLRGYCELVMRMGQRAPAFPRGDRKRKFAITLAALVAIVIGTAYADEAQKRKIVTSQYYVDAAIETKQPVVGAESGNYVVMYPNSAGGDAEHNEAGEINKRHVSTTLTVGSNGGDGINAAATDIPTVGAVNAGLNGKQDKISGTSGKLVTYGNTTGTVGSADIYNESGAYSTQTDALVNASHVNSAVANGFSELLSCREYADGHDGDMDYCLLYIVNTDMASGVYVPHN